jgi:thiamine biosynthesis lipoprotein
MSKKRLAAFTAAAAVLCLAIYFGAGGYSKYQSTVIGLFNTDITFTACAKNEREFIKYAEIVFGELEYCHKLFDIYDSYGFDNIKTVNDNAGVRPVAVDGPLIELILSGMDIYNETGGAVNIALGPVTEIWRRLREEGGRAELPRTNILNEAFRFSDIAGVAVDTAENAVFLKERGMRLDVGALAKGLAAERAIRKAKAAGLKSAVLDAGGNVIAVGKPLERGRETWSVGIKNPSRAADEGINTIGTLYVMDKAVVSSGGYERFFIYNGKRYGHIIDPATLFPSERYAGVTVIADDSGIADMLSTALFIMPVGGGEELLAKYGAGAVWVMEDGTVLTSKNFDAVSSGLIVDGKP